MTNQREAALVYEKPWKWMTPSELNAAVKQTGVPGLFDTIEVTPQQANENLTKFFRKMLHTVRQEDPRACPASGEEHAQQEEA